MIRFACVEVHFSREWQIVESGKPHRGCRASNTETWVDWRVGGQPGGRRGDCRGDKCAIEKLPGGED
ncbi:hypothetical protein E2C01_045365 [Portunus trituberculatus]|uniref:Uncharacterized protein n=1 Tax=Portunus trituberculatus TaxID=210409 RepID=A0A5B7G1U1_PORTR|nr:hypothetical protein [Portunus trituberculatus]